jgi:hypothetical protein
MSKLSDKLKECSGVDMMFGIEDDMIVISFSRSINHFGFYAEHARALAKKLSALANKLEPLQ